MAFRLAISVSNLEASATFYDTVLRPLGLARRASALSWGNFSIEACDDLDRLTRRVHVGFAARSEADIDAFWRVGIEAGFRDDGAPGPRPQYRADYYGAFLCDPDGNSVEAVRHGAMTRRGAIDHVWIRVRDVAASKRFYAPLAPLAGFRHVVDEPELIRFAGAWGSLTIVHGEPSRNVRLSFAVAGAKPTRLVDPDRNFVDS